VAAPAPSARAQEPAPAPPPVEPGDDGKPDSRHGPIRRAGDYGGILNPVAAGVIALSEDDPDGLRQLARGCGVTVAATSLLKLIFDRTWLGERPDGDRRSFPSGHTSGAMCGAAFVHYRYQDNKYTVPLGSVGVFVGYSRMWARKHHLRDVIAGTALAFAVAHNATHHRSGNEEGRRPPSPVPSLSPSLSPSLAFAAPDVSGPHLLLFERGGGDPAAELALDTLEPGVRGGLALGTRRAPESEAQLYLGLRFDGVF
jgi:hypothetical protein